MAQPGVDHGLFIVEQKDKFNKLKTPMKPKKIILRALAALLLLTAIFVINLIWFKPFFINHFYEKIFIEALFKNPELMSSIGVPIPGMNDKLTEATEAYQEEQRKWSEESLEVLLSYDRPSGDVQAELSYDILKWFLANNAEDNKFPHHDYPFNPTFGIQNGLPSFMDDSHNVGDEDDALAYNKRLHAFKVKFDQMMEGLVIREEKGIILPKFAMRKVIDGMQEFVDISPKENSLYFTFKEKLDRLDELSDERKQEILAETENKITERVYPAYQMMIDYFTKLLDKATDDDGVWKFPDGDAFYAQQLKNHTTTDYTPEEVHNIGLSEVARIGQEMRAILDELGYPNDSSIGYYIDSLSKDPKYLYPNTDEGRSAAIAEYERLITEISDNLDDVFDIRPKAAVEVKRVPEFREKTSAGAYYNPPAMDGSRPGTFYANLRDMNEIIQWGMATLTYHEAVPGHHFQLAIQRELTGLPTFRTVLPFTAYAEGWALYSERLAWEYGFHENPLTNLGRLQAEQFRAVRLVVDTGIHFKRWTREQAIKYMHANTGMPMGEVITEIERYIVAPGQACAYKIGMLKILELREKAKTALGDKFDIRDFHNVVLKNGSMPLEILESVVDGYIAEKA